MNKQKISAMMIMALMIFSVPGTVNAASLDLPKMQMKQLEAPTLPEQAPMEDYNQAVDNLMGEYQNQKDADNGSLELPTVESPTGTGKTAYKKFLQSFGDMWNDPNRQLKTPTLGVDTIKIAVAQFGAESTAAMEEVAAKDRANMAGYISKGLDTSSQWNLSSIKSGTAVTPATLGSVDKPTGWDAVKSKAANPDTSFVKTIYNPLGDMVSAGAKAAPATSVKDFINKF